MRFLADMGISLRTVAWLRSQGYDVIHLRDEGLQRLPDREILAKARQENRVILTVDLDFAQLLAIAQTALPSVILFRLGNKNYDLLNDRLEQVLGDCSEILDGGAIVSVGQESYRVRQLPIEGKS